MCRLWLPILAVAPQAAAVLAAIPAAATAGSRAAVTTPANVDVSQRHLNDQGGGKIFVNVDPDGLGPAGFGDRIFVSQTHREQPGRRAAPAGHLHRSSARAIAAQAGRRLPY